MRRAPVRLSLLVVAFAALGGFGLGAGCSHDARPAAQPAQPEEAPPLPPASGTPIGFLLDDARLKLSDDQRTKLKAIDDELAVKLSYLDTVVRNTGSGAASSKEEGSRGGLSFSGSGERNGQNAGNLSAPDAVGGNRAIGGGGPPPGTAADNAATLKRVPEVRAYDVRTAVARALALLDPEQQKIARQVLVDRGVDPDTGRTEAQGEPGSARREGTP